MFKEFKKFILRGNLVDLAIGFTVGAAFSTVARSLVDDILMPPIGLLVGKSDFTDYFVVLRAGETAGPYASVVQAQAAGAVTLNYGRFVNNTLTLFVVALSMFVAIRAFSRLENQMAGITGKNKEKPSEPSSKKCEYCLSTIPYRASRCPNCTSKLEAPKK